MSTDTPQPSRTGKVLALSMGRGLTMVVGVVTGMVAARILTKHDYATMRQTMLAYNFVGPLLSLSLPMAIYYFLPDAKGKEKGIVLDCFVTLLMLGGVFSLFLLCGGNRFLAARFNNPDLEQTLMWMVPYPLFALPAGILSATLVVKGRTTALSVYNVISRLALGVGIIIACVMTQSYTGPVIAQIVFVMLTFPVAIWLAFSSIKGRWRTPDLSSMKRMVAYTVPLGLAGMLGMLTLQLDKLIVSAMCPPEEFAVYANGAIEIPLIGIITGSIAAVILADMAKSCKSGKHDEALALFNKAAVRSALILLPTMAFLFVHATDFIRLLYSEKYLDSVVPFRIYLLILPVRIVFYGSALMALGRTKQILWRSIGDLGTNAILSVILVWKFGYLGAAAATVLTLYFWSVPVSFFQVAKGFQCSKFRVVPLPKLAVILLASTASAIVSALAIPMIQLDVQLVGILRLSIAAAFFLVTYGLLCKRMIPEASDIIRTLTKKIAWKLR